MAASLTACVGCMDNIKSFIEEHKGIRRVVLCICIVWSSIVIVMGLGIMLDRSLTGPESAFLTAVIALMQTPVGFYFYHRGSEECGRFGRQR